MSASEADITHRLWRTELALARLEERVTVLVKEQTELEGMVSGLRRVLMGLIVTIATSSLLVLVALLVTGRPQP